MPRIIPLDKKQRIVRVLDPDSYPVGYKLILEENIPDATGADSWRAVYYAYSGSNETDPRSVLLRFVSSLVPIDPTLGDALPTDPPPPPPPA